MNSTMNDFKDFFSNKKEKTEFLISEAIANVLSLVGYEYANKNISITLKGDYKIRGYKNELKQVILNFLNNSMDAFVDKKIKNRQITINIKDDDDFVYVIFLDNAGGVEEKYMEKIFEADFTTKGQNGTGIGLNICQMIIQNNFQGNIVANNKDNGLEITIILKK
jgi:C4-dicarboxylate-specific signal transduction histidine kinase